MCLTELNFIYVSHKSVKFALSGARQVDEMSYLIVR